MTIHKRNLVDYSLLTLFVASSGFPYFSSPNVYIFEFFMLLSVFILRRKSFDPKVILFFTFLILIFAIQSMIFNFFAPLTVFGFFIRVLNAYLIVKILGINFTLMYSKLLYYLSLISFTIYIPSVVLPSIWPFLRSLVPLFQWIDPTETHENIIIYTTQHLESFRNSGPFWEPGAFAGYLIIALIFSYIKNPSFKSKQNIVLLISILTTQSTTAFFALFVFLFFILYVYIKNIIFKIIVAAIILASGYFAFYNLDFLGKKVTEQLTLAQAADIKKDENTQRFLNVVRDIQDYENNELFGRGINSETRYSFGPKDQIRTVGLTDVLVKFGTPFFILMLIMLYTSIKSFVTATNKQNNLTNIGIFLSILVTLASEVYFNYPMYWSLLFLTTVYKLPRRSI